MMTVKVKTIEVSYQADDIEKDVASCPLESVAVARSYLQTVDADTEVFAIMALDASHHLNGIKILSIGTVSECPVDHNKLWRCAVELQARSLILLHTHPTNNMEASSADLQLTQQLITGGKLLGIAVVDHLIFGSDGSWLALRSENPELFS